MEEGENISMVSWPIPGREGADRSPYWERMKDHGAGVRLEPSGSPPLAARSHTSDSTTREEHLSQSLRLTKPILGDKTSSIDDNVLNLSSTKKFRRESVETFGKIPQNVEPVYMDLRRANTPELDNDDSLQLPNTMDSTREQEIQLEVVQLQARIDSNRKLLDTYSADREEQINMMVELESQKRTLTLDLEACKSRISSYRQNMANLDIVKKKTFFGFSKESKAKDKESILAENRRRIEEEIANQKRLTQQLNSLNLKIYKQESVEASQKQKEHGVRAKMSSDARRIAELETELLHLRTKTISARKEDSLRNELTETKEKLDESRSELEAERGSAATNAEKARLERERLNLRLLELETKFSSMVDKRKDQNKENHDKLSHGYSGLSRSPLESRTNFSRERVHSLPVGDVEVTESPVLVPIPQYSEGNGRTTPQSSRDNQSRTSAFDPQEERTEKSHGADRRWSVASNAERANNRYMEEAEREIERLHRRNRDLMEEIDRKDAEIDMVRNHAAKLQPVEFQIQTERNLHEVAMREKDSEILNLRSQLQHMYGIQKSLDDAIVRENYLKSQKMELENRMKQFEHDHEVSLANSLNENNNMTEMLQNLKTELADAKVKISEFEENESALKEENASAQEQHKREAEELTIEIENLKGSVDKAADLVMEKDKRIAELEKQIEQLQKKELELKVRDLTTQEAQRRLKDENQLLSDKAQSHAFNSNKLEEEVTRLKIQVQTLEQQKLLVEAAHTVRADSVSQDTNREADQVEEYRRNRLSRSKSVSERSLMNESNGNFKVRVRSPVPQNASPGTSSTMMSMAPRARTDSASSTMNRRLSTESLDTRDAQPNNVDRPSIPSREPSPEETPTRTYPANNPLLKQASSELLMKTMAMVGGDSEVGSASATPTSTTPGTSGREGIKRHRRSLTMDNLMSWSSGGAPKKPLPQVPASSAAQLAATMPILSGRKEGDRRSIPRSKIAVDGEAHDELTEARIQAEKKAFLTVQQYERNKKERKRSEENHTDAHHSSSSNSTPQATPKKRKEPIKIPDVPAERTGEKAKHEEDDMSAALAMLSKDGNLSAYQRDLISNILEMRKRGETIESLDSIKPSGKVTVAPELSLPPSEDMMKKMTMSNDKRMDSASSLNSMGSSVIRVGSTGSSEDELRVQPEQDLEDVQSPVTPTGLPPNEKSFNDEGETERPGDQFRRAVEDLKEETQKKEKRASEDSENEEPNSALSDPESEGTPTLKPPPRAFRSRYGDKSKHRMSGRRKSGSESGGVWPLNDAPNELPVVREEPEFTTTLIDLPHQVLVRVIVHMDAGIRAKMRLARVCLKFRTAVYDPLLWTNVDLHPFRSRVTDTVISSLLGAIPGQNKIRSLNLQGCFKIGDASLRLIAGRCPSLEEIDFSGCNISEGGISSLSRGCPCLHTLIMSNCTNLTDTALWSISNNLKSIRKIACSWCTGLTNASFQAAVSSGNPLQHIDFSYCDIGDDGLRALKQLPRSLVTLNLAYCEDVSDSGLFAISAHCKQLREIDLSNCAAVSPNGLAAIFRSCKYLRKVSLQSCPKVNDQTVNALATGCPYIEHINLAHCAQVSNTSVSALASRCREVKYLNLAGCARVTGAALPDLGRCSRLAQLDLTGMKDINFGNLTEIAVNCPLKNLSLAATKGISEQGRQYLEQMLPTCNIRY